MKQDILINKVHECSFKMVNKGIMDSKYRVVKLDMVDKLNLIDHSNLAQGVQSQEKKINSLQIVEIENQEGVIQKGSEIDVIVRYRSETVLDKQICELQIQLENQKDLYFTMVVDFRDANITIK